MVGRVFDTSQPDRLRRILRNVQLTRRAPGQQETFFVVVTIRSVTVSGCLPASSCAVVRWPVFCLSPPFRHQWLNRKLSQSKLNTYDLFDLFHIHSRKFSESV